MKVIVDIPELFIEEDDNMMVNITSDFFYYSNISSPYEGLHSNYKDGNLNQQLYNKLELISEQFKELIYLIKNGKTSINTGM